MIPILKLESFAGRQRFIGDPRDSASDRLQPIVVQDLERRLIPPYVWIVMRKRLNNKHVCISDLYKQQLAGTATPKMKVLNSQSIEERILSGDFFLSMSRLK